MAQVWGEVMQIKHLSIATQDPQRAATILAAMTGGRVEGFRSGDMLNGRVCMWGGDTDELVEFIPHGFCIVRREHGGAYFKKTDVPVGYNTTHVQLVATKPVSLIQDVAQEHGCLHGWRVQSGGPCMKYGLKSNY